jgi:hypothetical protein
MYVINSRGGFRQRLGDYTDPGVIGDAVVNNICMLALVMRAEVDVHIGPHSGISRHGLIGGMFIRMSLHFLVSLAGVYKCTTYSCSLCRIRLTGNYIVRLMD